MAACLDDSGRGSASKMISALDSEGNSHLFTLLSLHDILWCLASYEKSQAAAGRLHRLPGAPTGIQFMCRASFQWCQAPTK
jgi:hypothetical protein